MSGVAGACIEDNQRSSGAWVVVLDPTLPTDRPGIAWCMVAPSEHHSGSNQESGPRLIPPVIPATVRTLRPPGDCIGSH